MSRAGFSNRNVDHARLHHRPTTKFDEYYRCYPMVMAPGPARPDLNYGSKVLLPPSALDKVSKLLVEWPLLMEAINGQKNTLSHCGVFEFVAEEGRAYLPHWMMETLQLDVGDLIQLRTTSLELAKMVQLQPQSVNFLEISDPRAVLERAFRNFATLTKGDIFQFSYNDDVYAVAVLDVKPSTPKMGVSMIETDVSVEFAPPLGYVEPERVPRDSGTSTPRSVRGAVPAGGMLHTQGSMAVAINYDTLTHADSTPLSRFVGDGQRLSQKKAGRTAAPMSIQSAGTTAPVAHDNCVAAASQRATNGPRPLRLGPDQLFFGFPITPVKTQVEKDREKEDAGRPQFAGRGQTLRETAKN